MDRQAAEWSREALALLEARLADMRGESTKMTRGAFVTDFTAQATAAEVFQKTAEQLVGMLNLAFKLLMELETASERPAELWLRSIADWLTLIERGTTGPGGNDGPGQNAPGEWRRP